MLDIGIDFLGSIIGALCCSQCPVALLNVPGSIAATQNKKSSKIAAEATVASVCSISNVMVWLCNIDHVSPLCSIHNNVNAIHVSIAAEWFAVEKLKQFEHAHA